MTSIGKLSRSDFITEFEYQQYESQLEERGLVDKNHDGILDEHDRISHSTLQQLNQAARLNPYGNHSLIEPEELGSIPEKKGVGDDLAVLLNLPTRSERRENEIVQSIELLSQCNEQLLPFYQGLRQPGGQIPSDTIHQLLIYSYELSEELNSLFRKKIHLTADDNLSKQLVDGLVHFQALMNLLPIDELLQNHRDVLLYSNPDRQKFDLIGDLLNDISTQPLDIINEQYLYMVYQDQQQTADATTSEISFAEFKEFCNFEEAPQSVYLHYCHQHDTYNGSPYGEVINQYYETRGIPSELIHPLREYFHNHPPNTNQGNAYRLSQLSSQAGIATTQPGSYTSYEEILTIISTAPTMLVEAAMNQDVRLSPWQVTTQWNTSYEQQLGQFIALYAFFNPTNNDRAGIANEALISFAAIHGLPLGSEQLGGLPVPQLHNQEQPLEVLSRLYQSASDEHALHVYDFYHENSQLPSDEKLNCLETFNQGVRTLYDTHVRLGSTVDRSIQALQQRDLAFTTTRLEFVNPEGKPTTGVTEPVSFREGHSIAQTMKDQAGLLPGWHFYGFSICDGYHSIMLILDNRDPSHPKYFWADQWNSHEGWQEFTPQQLDQEIEQLTNEFWLREFENPDRKTPLRMRSQSRITKFNVPSDVIIDSHLTS